MEIREVLKQYLTDEALDALGTQAFDEFPEDEDTEICILINGKSELDGIDVN